MANPIDRDVAAREAADWMVRLNGRGVSNQALEEFYQWRRRPENAAAFGRVEQAWQQAGTLDRDPEIASAVQNVLASRRGRQGLWQRRAMLFGGLSIAAAAATIGLWPRSLRYETLVGEQRFVNLADGSRVHLNTDSAIRVDFSDKERRIELERGEVWFDVEHDAGRPFVVFDGQTSVRAIGTSFIVRHYPRGTRVLLASGRVEVRASVSGPVNLAAGQGLDVADGHIAVPVPVDVARETAWRSGHLSFKDTSLADAVREVDRYGVRGVSLDAPELGHKKINGLFEIGDQQAFVTAVTALFPLEAVTDKSGSVQLRGRASSAQ